MGRTALGTALQPLPGAQVEVGAGASAALQPPALRHQNLANCALQSLP